MDRIWEERRHKTHTGTFLISNMWQGLGPAQWLSASWLCQLVLLGGYDVSTRFDKIRDSTFSGNCQNIRTPRFCPPQPWLKVWTISICGIPTPECLCCVWQRTKNDYLWKIDPFTQSDNQIEKLTLTNKDTLDHLRGGHTQGKVVLRILLNSVDKGYPTQSSIMIFIYLYVIYHIYSSLSIHRLRSKVYA